MSIFPLPVFEADADPRHRDAMTDEEMYARLEPPKTVVVKFGYMKLVGEFKYGGSVTPGCGSKLVARTHRGTELVEMLTTTCENAGCSKSITRQEMMEFIENSGGRDFPFRGEGRILRVATAGDLNAQSALDLKKPDLVKTCKASINDFNLPMKLVEAEPILGEELLTFYFMSEQRVDFRELVRELAGAFKTRIEMRQVGARDEARLVADYERCGQHCCCKNFLKVLKPVSMRSAKLQKATLDPLKISGRCGRLMCCLRYEDQTYKQLKANLPHRNVKVGTAEGPGTVVDSKVLVQLVLVRLEHDDREIAVPVEELMDPADCPPPGAKEAQTMPAQESDSGRGRPADKSNKRAGEHRHGKSRHRRRRGSTDDQQTTASSESKDRDQPDKGPPSTREAEGGSKPTRRRRRRGRQRGPQPPETT